MNNDIDDHDQPNPEIQNGQDAPNNEENEFLEEEPEPALVNYPETI